MHYKNITKTKAVREMFKEITRKVDGAHKDIELHLIDFGYREGMICSVLKEQKNGNELMAILDRLLGEMFFSGILIQKKTDVKIDWDFRKKEDGEPPIEEEVRHTYLG